MPLDPKYSGLPYIAQDSQDTYESSDLPESEQHAQLKNVSEESSSISNDIEQSSVNHSAAFDKFKDRQLSAKDVDFSDRVYTSKKIGYMTLDRRNYEIMDEEGRHLETPMQRFQRMQAELRILVEDVEKIKSSATNDATGDTLVTPVQLSTMVNSLQQQVGELSLNKILGPDSQYLALFDPQSGLEKRIHVEIDKIKSQKTSGDSAASKSDKQQSYEIYGSVASQKQPLTQLEQRISRLESAIGANHLKNSILSGDVANKPLCEAVQKLSSKSSLLESHNLDSVEARLSALNHKLQQLTSERKQILSDADTQQRVAELYELVKKWDRVMSSLPDIVSRLESLKVLHEQAMQFSGALNHLDESQRASQSQIAAAHNLLCKLEDRLTCDLDTVLKNTSVLQQKSASKS